MSGWRDGSSTVPASGWPPSGRGTSEPLAAEVWVFDEDLARVLLVHHRWRGRPPWGEDWSSCFPGDAALVREHARWLGQALGR